MKRLIPVFLLFALLLLTACGVLTKAEVAHESSIFAMDTYMSFRVHGDESLLDEAEDIVRALEAELSVSDMESAIYEINSTVSVSLSEVGYVLLSEALELCKATGGALDVTIYPVVKAWGFTTGEYRVPDGAELGSLLELVDYTKVELSQDGTVTLPRGVMLDLGGVAKGYAGRLIRERLMEGGVTSALLNLGGNVQAVGSKPDGSPWRVGIKDPAGDGNVCVLEISDMAVVTSGGYERYFEQDGKTYWHIIDPATGAPAGSGLVSVSVIGEDGLLCDGLSTALFVMGLAEAADFWRSRDDFEAVFVTDGGGVFITQGLTDIFETAEGGPQEVTVIERD